MRTLPFTLAMLLACAPLAAQDAVLVLAPAPTIAVQAGTGQPGFSGDGAAAILARLASPAALAQDASGNLYIADTRNHRIRRVDTTGVITTIAGTGTQGFAGDNGPATQAQLDSPQGLALAANGTLYIADTRNQRIRFIDSTGTVSTIAGNGRAGFSGDGSAAASAQLSAPQGIALGPTGALYVADTGNHRIRRIDTQGNIATVAGDGVQDKGSTSTGVTSHLDSPTAVAVRADGTLLIADRRNDRVLLLAPDGTLQLLATGGTTLRRPNAAVFSGTDTLVADTGHQRVTRITSDGTGTALGSGEQGAVDVGANPLHTAMGAPSAVLPANTPAADFVTLDREHGQVLQVTLARLDFPDTTLATTSPSRTVTLKNAGASALSVSRITVPQPFAVTATSTCGTPPFTLDANTACTVAVAFLPQTEDVASGLLQVSVAAGAPQRLLLSGKGVRTGTALASSTTLQTSGTVAYVGTPLTLTAAVLGSATTAPTGSAIFLDGSTQLGQAPLNSSAQATFSTSSLQAGTHTLTARYTGDTTYGASTSAPTQITLAAPPDFTFAVSGSTRITVQKDTAGAITFQLQPANGALNQSIALSVDGFPTGTAVNVTPVPITLGGNPVTVSIAFKLPVNVSFARRSLVWAALLLPCLPLLSSRRRYTVLACTLLPCVAALQGCGGGFLSNNAAVSGQAVGSTYPITITATCPGVSGPLTHTATFTVIVQ